SNTAFGVAMATLGKRAYQRLLAAADDPQAAQLETLRRILARCAPTEEGQRLGFASIRDWDDFRTRAPITTYEDIRPAIGRQLEPAALTLAPEPPIMYARTSGTTGKPKYIPVTPTVLTELREAQRAMSYVLHQQLGAFEGQILGLGGAPREETLALG